MKAKIFYVTEERRLNKKRTESKVFGFVSVFGWESAEEKARRKYPNHQISGLHEKPRRFR